MDGNGRLEEKKGNIHKHFTLPSLLKESSPGAKKRSEFEAI